MRGKADLTMDYQEAATYWEKEDAHAVRMDREALLRAMERYIDAHNTCALATGFGGFVRCTPIEYRYFEGKFWMLSEGGLKFRSLEHNRRVCLAVYEPYGQGPLAGMQIVGDAEMIEPWSPEYLRFLKVRGLPEVQLRKLSHPMYLIRVTPSRIDYLSSEFKKHGFSSRQHITF